MPGPPTEGMIPLMPAPQSAPAWAMDLSVAFESGASGQFILYGTVHDRLAVGGRLVNIERYIQDELLGSFDVIFDFAHHQLVIETSDGKTESFALAPMTVADFHAEFMQRLHRLGVEVGAFPVPLRGDPVHRVGNGHLGSVRGHPSSMPDHLSTK